MLFKKVRKVQATKIVANDQGEEVLRKTEDFQLYVIRTVETDEILGTVLLTESQENILNASCNEQGIKFSRR